MDRRLLLFGAIGGALAACTPRAPRSTAPLTLFAAASLTDALTEIAAAYRAETGREIRPSFAASGALARQIEAGAPADVVLLADQKWMDRLARTGRIQPGARRDLVGNALVLIARPDTTITGDPIAWVAQDGRKLVIGDPDSVPAGAYARDWLRARGAWDRLQSHLATAADVRAVRTFVARGEADLGVVYRSDAVKADQVRVVAQPPADQQPSIRYPAAVVTGAQAGAAEFLAYLSGAKAQTVFRTWGFTALS